MVKLLKRLHQSLQFQHVIAGFSGGADSTSLLVLLQEMRQSLGYTLEAVHFQHNLRGSESEDDEQWCLAFCNQRKIPCRTLTLDLSRSGSLRNVEERAREQRLTELAELVKEQPSPSGTVIALGHHQMDRIENLFMRLLRGSNTSGLTSLRPIQQIAGTTIVRPLLRWRKDDIQRFLLEHGISDWREDSSNQENVFLRNELRNTVIPKFLQLARTTRSGILQSLDVLDTDADYLESEAEKALSSLEDGSKLKTPAFCGLHDAIKFRVLGLWFEKNGLGQLRINKNLLPRLNKELNHLTGRKRIPVSGDLELLVTPDSITLVWPDDCTADPERTWYWRKEAECRWGNAILIASTANDREQITSASATGSCAFFDRKAVGDSIRIRCWQPGDRLVPFGKHKPVRLKKLFNDARISAIEKRLFPLLCQNSPESPILWVPSVKRSDRALVTEHTGDVLCIKVQFIK